MPTLPFFALSWILTLFSHDVDTLEPIQRMFDYLLSRNPISAIYLAVAILVAKKPQLLKMVRDMGAEAMDDPSVLHPLFARLPPLVADSPDDSRTHAWTPHQTPSVEKQEPIEEDANPYEPIELSTIFALADDMLARYPWDGPDIKGHEILGEASSVVTYAGESGQTWSLTQAETLVHGEVVRPGAGAMDDMEDEEEPAHPPVKHRRRRIRIPRNRTGTIIAVGVVLVGIGIAVYGSRSGGPRSNWARWWSAVVRDLVSRGGLPVARWRDSLRSWSATGSDALSGALRRVL